MQSVTSTGGAIPLGWDAKPGPVTTRRDARELLSEWSLS